MWGFYYAIIRTPVKQPGFSRKYPDPAFFFRVAQMEYIKTFGERSFWGEILPLRKKHPRVVFAETLRIFFANIQNVWMFVDSLKV